MWETTKKTGSSKTESRGFVSRWDSKVGSLVVLHHLSYVRNLGLIDINEDPTL